MPGKHCCFGKCRSDSRYDDKYPGVLFFPFPKPKTQLDRCMSWIKACGRPQLKPEKIGKHHYVCSKHFIDGKPTTENPDPIPCDCIVSRKMREGQKRVGEKTHTRVSIPAKQIKIMARKPLLPRGATSLDTNADIFYKQGQTEKKDSHVNCNEAPKDPQNLVMAVENLGALPSVFAGGNYGDGEDDDDDSEDNNFIISLEDNGDEDDLPIKSNSTASNPAVDLTGQSLYTSSSTFGGANIVTSSPASCAHSDANAFSRVPKVSGPARIQDSSDTVDGVIAFSPSSAKFQHGSETFRYPVEHQYNSYSSSSSYPATSLDPAVAPYYESVSTFDTTGHAVLEYGHENSGDIGQSKYTSTVDELWKSPRVEPGSSHPVDLAKKGFETIQLDNDSSGIWSEAVFLSTTYGVSDSSISNLKDTSFNTQVHNTVHSPRSISFHDSRSSSKSPGFDQSQHVTPLGISGERLYSNPQDLSVPQPDVSKLPDPPPYGAPAFSYPPCYSVPKLAGPFPRTVAGESTGPGFGNTQGQDTAANSMPTTAGENIQKENSACTCIMCYKGRGIVEWNPPPEEIDPVLTIDEEMLIKKRPKRKRVRNATADGKRKRLLSSDMFESVIHEAVEYTQPALGSDKFNQIRQLGTLQDGQCGSPVIVDLNKPTWHVPVVSQKTSVAIPTPHTSSLIVKVASPSQSKSGKVFLKPTEVSGQKGSPYPAQAAHTSKGPVSKQTVSPQLPSLSTLKTLASTTIISAPTLVTATSPTTIHTLPANYQIIYLTPNQVIVCPAPVSNSRVNIVSTPQEQQQLAKPQNQQKAPVSLLKNSSVGQNLTVINTNSESGEQNSQNSVNQRAEPTKIVPSTSAEPARHRLLVGSAAKDLRHVLQNAEKIDLTNPSKVVIMLKQSPNIQVCQAQSISHTATTAQKSPETAKILTSIPKDSIYTTSLLKTVKSPQVANQDAKVASHSPQGSTQTLPNTAQKNALGQHPVTSQTSSLEVTQTLLGLIKSHFQEQTSASAENTLLSLIRNNAETLSVSSEKHQPPAESSTVKELKSLLHRKSCVHQTPRLPQEGLPSNYIEDWVNQAKTYTTNHPKEDALLNELRNIDRTISSEISKAQSQHVIQGTSHSESSVSRNHSMTNRPETALSSSRLVSNPARETLILPRPTNIIKLLSTKSPTVPSKQLEEHKGFAKLPSDVSSSAANTCLSTSLKRSDQQSEPLTRFEQAYQPSAVGTNAGKLTPSMSKMQRSLSDPNFPKKLSHKSHKSSSVSKKIPFRPSGKRSASALVACSKGIKLRIKLNELKRDKAKKKRTLDPLVSKIHSGVPETSEFSTALGSLKDKDMDNNTSTEVPEDSGKPPSKQDVANRTETAEEMFQRFQEQAMQEVFKAQLGVGYLSRSLRPTRTTMAFVDKYPPSFGSGSTKKKDSEEDKSTDSAKKTEDTSHKIAVPAESHSSKANLPKKKVPIPKRRTTEDTDSHEVKVKQPKLAIKDYPRLKQDNSISNRKKLVCANILAGHKVYVKFNTFENVHSGRVFLVPFFNLGGTRTQFDVEDIEYINKAVVEFEKDEKSCARHLLFYSREGNKAAFLRKETHFQTDQINERNYKRSSFILEGFKREAKKPVEVPVEQWKVDNKVSIEIDRAEIDNDIEIAFEPCMDSEESVGGAKIDDTAGWALDENVGRSAECGNEMKKPIVDTENSMEQSKTNLTKLDDMYGLSQNHLPNILKRRSTNVPPYSAKEDLSHSHKITQSDPEKSVTERILGSQKDTMKLSISEITRKPVVQNPEESQKLEEESSYTQQLQALIMSETLCEVAEADASTMNTNGDDQPPSGELGLPVVDKESCDIAGQEFQCFTSTLAAVIKLEKPDDGYEESHSNHNEVSVSNGHTEVLEFPNDPHSRQHVLSEQNSLDLSNVVIKEEPVDDYFDHQGLSHHLPSGSHVDLFEPEISQSEERSSVIQPRMSQEDAAQAEVTLQQPSSDAGVDVNTVEPSAATCKDASEERTVITIPVTKHSDPVADSSNGAGTTAADTLVSPTRVEADLTPETASETEPLMSESPLPSSSVSESSEISSSSDIDEDGDDVEDEDPSLTGTMSETLSHTSLASPELTCGTEGNQHPENKKIMSLVESLRQRLTQDVPSLPPWFANKGASVIEAKIRKKKKKRRESKQKVSKHSEQICPVEKQPVYSVANTSGETCILSQSVPSTSITSVVSSTSASDTKTGETCILSQSVPSTSITSVVSSTPASEVSKTVQPSALPPVTSVVSTLSCSAPPQTSGPSLITTAVSSCGIITSCLSVTQTTASQPVISSSSSHNVNTIESLPQRFTNFPYSGSMLLPIKRPENPDKKVTAQAQAKSSSTSLITSEPQLKHKNDADPQVSGQIESLSDRSEIEVKYSVTDQLENDDNAISFGDNHSTVLQDIYKREILNEGQDTGDKASTLSTSKDLSHSHARSENKSIAKNSTAIHASRNTKTVDQQTVSLYPEIKDSGQSEGENEVISSDRLSPTDDLEIDIGEEDLPETLLTLQPVLPVMDIDGHSSKTSYSSSRKKAPGEARHEAVFSDLGFSPPSSPSGSVNTSIYSVEGWKTSPLKLSKHKNKVQQSRSKSHSKEHHQKSFESSLEQTTSKGSVASYLYEKFSLHDESGVNHKIRGPRLLHMPANRKVANEKPAQPKPPEPPAQIQGVAEPISTTELSKTPSLSEIFGISVNKELTEKPDLKPVILPESTPNSATDSQSGIDMEKTLEIKNHRRLQVAKKGTSNGRGRNSAGHKKSELGFTEKKPQPCTAAETSRKRQNSTSSNISDSNSSMKAVQANSITSSSRVTRRNSVSSIASDSNSSVKMTPSVCSTGTPGKGKSGPSSIASDDTFNAIPPKPFEDSKPRYTWRQLSRVAKKAATSVEPVKSIIPCKVVLTRVEHMNVGVVAEPGGNVFIVKQEPIEVKQEPVNEDMKPMDCMSAPRKVVKKKRKKAVKVTKGKTAPKPKRDIVDYYAAMLQSLHKKAHLLAEAEMQRKLEEKVKKEQEERERKESEEKAQASQGQKDESKNSEETVKDGQFDGKEEAQGESHKMMKEDGEDVEEAVDENEKSEPENEAESGYVDDKENETQSTEQAQSVADTETGAQSEPFAENQSHITENDSEKQQEYEGILSSTDKESHQLQPVLDKQVMPLPDRTDKQAEDSTNGLVKKDVEKMIDTAIMDISGGGQVSHTNSDYISRTEFSQQYHEEPRHEIVQKEGEKAAVAVQFEKKDVVLGGSVEDELAPSERLNDSEETEASLLAQSEDGDQVGFIPQEEVEKLLGLDIDDGLPFHQDTVPGTENDQTAASSEEVQKSSEAYCKIKNSAETLHNHVSQLGENVNSEAEKNTPYSPKLKAHVSATESHDMIPGISSTLSTAAYTPSSPPVHQPVSRKNLQVSPSWKRLLGQESFEQMEQLDVKSLKPRPGGEQLSIPDELSAVNSNFKFRLKLPTGTVSRALKLSKELKNVFGEAAVEENSPPEQEDTAADGVTHEELGKVEVVQRQLSQDKLSSGTDQPSSDTALDNTAVPSQMLPPIPKLRVKLDLKAVCAIQKAKNQYLQTKKKSKKTKKSPKIKSKAMDVSEKSSIQFQQDMEFYMRSSNIGESSTAREEGGLSVCEEIEQVEEKTNDLSADVNVDPVVPAQSKYSQKSTPTEMAVNMKEGGRITRSKKFVTVSSDKKLATEIGIINKEDKKDSGSAVKDLVSTAAEADQMKSERIAELCTNTKRNDGIFSSVDIFQEQAVKPSIESPGSKEVKNSTNIGRLLKTSAIDINKLKLKLNPLLAVKKSSSSLSKQKDPDTGVDTSTSQSVDYTAAKGQLVTSLATEKECLESQKTVHMPKRNPESVSGSCDDVNLMKSDTAFMKIPSSESLSSQCLAGTSAVTSSAPGGNLKAGIKPLPVLNTAKLCSILKTFQKKAGGTSSLNPSLSNTKSSIPTASPLTRSNSTEKMGGKANSRSLLRPQEHSKPNTEDEQMDNRKVTRSRSRKKQAESSTENSEVVVRKEVLNIKDALRPQTSGSSSLKVAEPAELGSGYESKNSASFVKETEEKTERSFFDCLSDVSAEVWEDK